MKHFVLFKLKPESNKNETYDLFTETYNRIEEELEFVSNVKVSQNCYERAVNYDLMVEMIVSSPEKLVDYLDCRQHKELIEKTKHSIESVVMFDY